MIENVVVSYKEGEGERWGGEGEEKQKENGREGGIYLLVVGVAPW